MESTLDLRDAIASTWFGAGLPAASARRLAAIGRHIDAEPGETLLTEGQPASALHLVLEGRVGIVARLPGQGEATLMTIEPGDIVGWSALLAPMPATATARVIERARLVTFPRDGLRSALDGDPALAAVVYRQALDAVSRRLLAALHQLLDLGEGQAVPTGGQSW
jgi:CRP-like cAMP-binding protein